MTRKKWNRLRRRYPQLFGRLKPWEAMHHHERELMKSVTVKAAIARMHSLFISDFAEFEYLPPHTFTYYAFNPAATHPAQEAPLHIPGLGGKWYFRMDQLGPDPAVEPGFPPQSFPGVEVTQDRFLVDGKFHVEQSPPLPPQTPDKESCPGV